MRIILLALALSGCMHTRTLVVEDKTVTDKLQQDVIRLSYMIAHDSCDSIYGICLGEGKKSKKDCSEAHEKCVVNVYNEWKDLIK
jgi:hypothetical protein